MHAATLLGLQLWHCAAQLQAYSNAEGAGAVAAPPLAFLNLTAAVIDTHTLKTLGRRTPLFLSFFLQRYTSIFVASFFLYSSIDPGHTLIVAPSCGPVHSQITSATWSINLKS